MKGFFGLLLMLLFSFANFIVNASEYKASPVELDVFGYIDTGPLNVLTNNLNLVECYTLYIVDNQSIKTESSFIIYTNDNTITQLTTIQLICENHNEVEVVLMFSTLSRRGNSLYDTRNDVISLKDNTFLKLDGTEVQTV